MGLSIIFLTSVVHQKVNKNSFISFMAFFAITITRQAYLFDEQFRVFLVNVPQLNTITAHKTTSLADEDNSAYYQSSGAPRNFKVPWAHTPTNTYKPIEISIERGHLNTDVQARDRTWNFLFTRMMP